MSLLGSLYRCAAGARAALFLLLGAGLAGSVAGASEAPERPVLETIKARGYLICGVGIDDTGFALQQLDGDWAGFDVDFCRAVAAAALGDARAVEFVPLDSLNRLKVLGQGGIDVLFRTTTYTLARDVADGFEFPAITFYDSQRVLAYADTGARRLGDLSGRTICANSGTTSIANIRAARDRLGLEIEILEIATQSGRWRAFFGRDCDGVTADGSDLAAMMARRPQFRDDLRLLEDEIANEPLGPVVREGDQQWEEAIRWVVNLTIAAEAAGLGQASDAAALARLGLPDGALLGLAPNWARAVIQQVGHYGEIFDRNLGAGSDLGLERGRNRLWRDGGLIYPLPMGAP